MGPSPPTFTQAQMNNAAAINRRKGPPQVSSHLIDSIPRSAIPRLMAQNSMKQRNSPVPIPTQPGSTLGKVAMPGHITSSSLKMAKPPIQVWMPNQPQATMARSMAGMLAPKSPNDERVRTGKGMP